MGKRRRNIMIVTVLASLALASGAMAQEWPGWRGPQRDGHAVSFEAPESWPRELEKVWRTEVGAGYSSPVAGDGRICVHTREGDEEVASCLAADSGKLLWNVRYPAPYTKNSYAMRHGKGPNATPVMHQGKLYTLGMSGILSAIDVATARLLWRADHSARVSTKKLFCGTSASPLIDGDSVIVHVGDDVGGGVLVAFDAATGEQRWNWQGAGPGYASPVAVELAGRRQIVTMTSGSVVAVDAADGRLLWQIDFEDKWNENIVTPVFHGNVLIAAGVRRGTLAYRIEQKDGAWSTGEHWARADLPLYMSSPVIEGEVLYGFSSARKGQLFALDLRTGASHWNSEGRLGMNAAVIAAGDDHIAALTTEGELIFVARTPRALKVVARYPAADSAPWAHPVFFGRRVAIKDATGLTLWRIDEGEPVEPSRSP